MVTEISSKSSLDEEDRRRRWRERIAYECYGRGELLAVALRVSFDPWVVDVLPTRVRSGRELLAS